MDKTNGNGRKTMVVANWKVYLGLIVIIGQIFLYGFGFIQDRNMVITRVEKTEDAIKEIRVQLRVLEKVQTMEQNLKHFMEKQGYKYID